MWLSKPVEVPDNSNKTLAFYEICSFTVHYEFVMFFFFWGGGGFSGFWTEAQNKESQNWQFSVRWLL
jgi:hypothetical protein